MAQTYTYTTVVGGNCCYFGQVDKVIPQPGDNLLILGICDCHKIVMGKLKAGENAACGQALYFDVATEELTVTPIANAFYGISKGPVTGGANPIPLPVYVYGGFDIDQVVVAGGTVDAALKLEARGLGIFFEQRI